MNVINRWACRCEIMSTMAATGIHVRSQFGQLGLPGMQWRLMYRHTGSMISEISWSLVHRSLGQVRT